MNARQLERLTRVRALLASGEAKRRRVDAGLSLRELADACGVDATTVWRWEEGRRIPRGHHAQDYARVLDLLAPRSPERAS